MDVDHTLELRKRHMQNELILKDSDNRKNERDMQTAELGIKDVKHKILQLQNDLVVKELAMKKLGEKKIQLQAEMIKLKHQIANPN
ncbi:MAG: hypothetical protein WCI36_03470 [bacterium]